MMILKPNIIGLVLHMKAAAACFNPALTDIGVKLDIAAI